MASPGQVPAWSGQQHSSPCRKRSPAAKGVWQKSDTWWTFRIFFIFFCSGEGKGESEALGGWWGRFFIENPRGGGFSRGARAGRVFAGNLEGGGDFFFFGAEIPAKDRSIRKSDRKATERVPKTKSDRTPFADLLLRHSEFLGQSCTKMLPKPKLH